MCYKDTNKLLSEKILPIDEYAQVIYKIRPDIWASHRGAWSKSRRNCHGLNTSILR